ncbi:MAG: hypothetical protein IT211_01530 [Armatimonadetes bacterium]|nr:hypothetical protein [Armatimonadota bacterium]
METYPTTHQELWSRLLQFQLDQPGAALPFSRRLARENSWSQRHTERVIEEYRRFLFLAMAAGHPVTPSVDVDQAWHLHLTYTRSYWDDLCPNVLREPLHHQPTKGGNSEGAKFQDWYARTLQSYQAAFGVAPPADIWPAPAVRLAAESRIRQVSSRTHWVIRKPTVGAVGIVAAAALLGLLLTGCDGGSIALILAFSIPIAVIVGVVMLSLKVRHKAQRQTKRTNRQCSASTGSSYVAADTGGYWLGSSTTTATTESDAGASGSESDSSGWGSDSSSSDSSSSDSGGGDSGCSGCGGCGGGD